MTRESPSSWVVRSTILNALYVLAHLILMVYYVDPFIVIFGDFFNLTHNIPTEKHAYLVHSWKNYYRVCSRCCHWHPRALLCPAPKALLSSPKSHHAEF